MAHSTLHFTAGMAVGSLWAVPRLLLAWHRGEALAARFRDWFIAGYAVGTFAVIPGILRRLGVSDAVCDGWWMNVFLFYPAINAVKPGAETSGPLLLGAALGCQYLLLVAAVLWTKRRLRTVQQAR